MAKNFKNNGVLGFITAIIEGVWCGIRFCLWHLATLVVCVLITLWKACLLITSPLWFPVMIAINPERAARGINDKYRIDGLLKPAYLDWVITYVHNVCIYYLMRWLWTPVIALLPMSKKAEFMRLGHKRLNEYPTKVQVAFYKSHNAGGKQSLIASNSLSREVFNKIWKEPFERENWIEAGLNLTKEQVSDMVLGGATEPLWRYFKRNTPDKEMLGMLVKYARQGYATAQDILLKLIRQQRPSAELIGQLLNIDDNRFVGQVNEVIDQYADLDAVNCSASSMIGDLTEEEKQKLAHDRWNNFCRSKKEISRAAQKKMCHMQYTIFADTMHKLDYYALQHLCLTVGEQDYLKEIVQNEFERIDEKLQTALKSAYWRYSIYLEVKQRLATSAKK